MYKKLGNLTEDILDLLWESSDFESAIIEALNMIGKQFAANSVCLTEVTGNQVMNIYFWKPGGITREPNEQMKRITQNFVDKTMHLTDDKEILYWCLDDTQGITAEVLRECGVRTVLLCPIRQDGLCAYLGVADLERLYCGRRLLLVEDNALNREIAVELLTAAGAEVDTAENGKIALEKVISSPPGYYQLIFMDIQMPVMDGCAATVAIRALKREDTKTLPIVAMTANAFADDRLRTGDAGMNDHLAKPIDMDLRFYINILLKKTLEGNVIISKVFPKFGTSIPQT